MPSVIPVVFWLRNGEFMRQTNRPGRTLVLGGGFIGSHVANVAQSEGHDVTVFTRSRPIGIRDELMSGCDVVVGDALRNLNGFVKPPMVLLGMHLVQCFHRPHHDMERI